MTTQRLLESYRMFCDRSVAKKRNKYHRLNWELPFSTKEKNRTWKWRWVDPEHRPMWNSESVVWVWSILFPRGKHWAFRRKRLHEKYRISHWGARIPYSRALSALYSLNFHCWYLLLGTSQALIMSLEPSRDISKHLFVTACSNFPVCKKIDVLLKIICVIEKL